MTDSVIAKIMTYFTIWKQS